jgi:hypothetical protein
MERMNERLKVAHNFLASFAGVFAPRSGGRRRDWA